MYGEKCGDIGLYFQDQRIQYVSSESHLGHLIGPEKSVKRKCIESTIYAMYSKLNLLLQQFSHADYHIKYNLFKCYCTSAYGSQLWNFSSNDVKQFYIAWRKCVRRIFDVPNNTHCSLLPYLCQDDNIDVQLHRRFLKFIHKALNSTNVLVSNACKLVLNGSGSDVCHSLNYVCSQYDLQKQCLIDCLPWCSSSSDDNLIRHARFILDLLDMGRMYPFEEPYLRDIIYHICTC